MKKFYKENRVFVILMGIALVCIAIIIGLLASYVLSSNGGEKYGNRLDGISDVEIKDEFKDEMESKILEKEKVEDTKINFNIKFQKDTSVTEAQSVATSCMEFFEEDYLNYYDIQFFLTKSEYEESTSTFPMLGYRKAQAANITWSNNSKK